MKMDLFAARFSLLLDAWHGKGEQPPSTAEVTRKVGLSLGCVVPPATIESALNGTALPPEDVTRAIEEVYRAPGLFSDTAAAAEMSDALRGCIAIRDRYDDQGTNVIARGTTLGDQQLVEVLDFIGASASGPQRG